MNVRTLEAERKGETRTATPFVLTYHVIGPQASQYIYSATCEQFDQHLAWLGTLRDNPATKSLFPEITFDDGGTSDHLYAQPLLNKRRCRGKFFVTAGLIGNRSEFMTWDEVRSLSAEGHSVQSHGWSHLLLTRANPTELAHELETSKKQLEDRLGAEISELSLPGGRWNVAVLKACAKAGYKRVYHSNPWVKPELKYGIEFVGRLMVRNSMD